MDAFTAAATSGDPLPPPGVGSLQPVTSPAVASPRPLLQHPVIDTLAHHLRAGVDPNATPEAVRQRFQHAASSPTAQALVGRLQQYAPAGAEMVRDAFALAAIAHKGQRRQSGEEYIDHPVAVATLLLNLQLDPELLVAALLHDVVEDTPVPLADLRELFGEPIARIVDGVTKLSGLEALSKEEAQAHNYRKLIIAAAADPRVLVIKIADRLHNMRTLGATPPEKQRRIARETLNIYAPLAQRLGMWRIKSELEDLSFRVFRPSEYDQIEAMMRYRSAVAQERLEQTIQDLTQAIRDANIAATIAPRPRSLYAIWREMERRPITLEKLCSQISLRVIVSDPNPDQAVMLCYLVLGIVHRLWTQVPGEFDDYISRPKEASYQSLHTTVLIPGGVTCELQIRTETMHNIAENGIATVWQSGASGPRAAWNFENKLRWLRDLIDWRIEIADNRRFVEGLQPELDEQIYVLTPKGNVITLPVDSTPIDFAYRIHSQIGDALQVARVNGDEAPLDAQLKNGDIVEIITSDQASGPSATWLNSVRTGNAKNHIRRYLRRKERQENITAGRQEIDYELSRLDMQEAIGRLPELTGSASMDDALASIGTGEVSARSIALSLLHHELGGDSFSTALEQPNSRLPEQLYRLTIRILAHDRVGLWRDISTSIARVDGNIVEMQQRQDEHTRQVALTLTIAFPSLTGLIALLDEIGRTPGVVSARRLRPETADVT